MRPQDLYREIGDTVEAVRARSDEVALLRAPAETWDPASLRVDAGSPWTSAETVSAVIDDLAAAEESLRAAAGRLEAAWAALGRLASD